MLWPWAEISALKAKVASAEALLRRAADDALVASGQRAVFAPDDKRYQPRPLADQQAEQKKAAAARAAAQPRARERESIHRAAADARAKLHAAMHRLTPREEEAGTEE